MVMGQDVYRQEEYWEEQWNGYRVEHSSINAEFRLHSHDFSEAFVIVSGSANHIVGARSYPLQRGDVFVIKGDMAHGFSDVHELEIINLMYNPTTFLTAETQLNSIPGFRPLFVIEPEIRQHSDYPCVLSLSDADLAYVVMTSDVIVKELAGGEADHDIMTRMTFLALLAFLSLRYNSSGAHTQKIQSLANAVHYMRENIGRPIKIADVAASVFLSTRHLARLFQEYYNTTPIDYLTGLRLHHSLMLLSKSDMRVREVAERCGFSDPSYFSRVFKQMYGISPQMAMKHIS